MTGYGSLKREVQAMRVSVEIKSLNSKYLELNLKLPRQFSHKELFIRNECSRLIERGKASITITVEPLETALVPASNINEPLVTAYYRSLERIATELGADRSELLKLALSMPEATAGEDVRASEEEWEAVWAVFLEAVEAFSRFRADEGIVLEKDLRLRVANIQQFLSEVEVAEPQRIPLVRERLEGIMKEYIGAENIDQNRFEQELVFYIDKLDITEEKVRLRSHCDYFLSVLDDEVSHGKKLGFITQEMGREINTLGSKAYDASIQQVVVRMKEELEKIKEQVLNLV